MCNECWKEFKGWCKAFTKTEIFLVLLEAFLLFLLIFFLIFLIMHMMVCSTWIQSAPDVPDTTTTTGTAITTSKAKPGPGPIDTDLTITTTVESQSSQKSTSEPHSTLDPKVKCTWEVSKKTEAKSRYYEGGGGGGRESGGDTATTEAMKPIIVLGDTKDALRGGGDTEASSVSAEDDEGQSWEVEGAEALALDDDSDGEEVADSRRGALLALVRATEGHAQGATGTFGCVATAISTRWALTAASCIEAVEEVSSLDEFVLLEPARAGGGWAGRGGRARAHVLADVQLHPLWQGANHTYDVAALRSEDNFRSAVQPLELPTLLDHYLVTLGERMTLLGFGPFRTEEPTSPEKPVRAVSVYLLPGAQCRAQEGGEEEGGSAGGEGWAVRHLSRGRAEDAAGGCGASAWCAGVRWARGAACGWCAGSPLARGRRLLALQADARRPCALACPPAPLAPLAPARDWIDMLLNPE